MYLFSFLNPNFLLCPLFLMVSSVSGLSCSVLGVFQLVRRAHRLRLITWHGLSSLLVLGLSLAASVSTSLLLSAGTEDLAMIAKNNSIIMQGDNLTRTLEVWDLIQDRFQCCGMEGDQGQDQWLPLLGDR